MPLIPPNPKARRAIGWLYMLAAFVLLGLWLSYPASNWLAAVATGCAVVAFLFLRK